MDELEREEYQRLKEENAILRERLETLKAKTDEIDVRMTELWASIQEISKDTQAPTIH